MAVFEIELDPTALELLANASMGKSVGGKLPKELNVCVIEYLDMLFSCGRSKILPWFEQLTIRNLAFIESLRREVNIYKKLSWNSLSCNTTWYPIRIDLSIWHPPLIIRPWSKCEILSMESIKGRELDARDCIALYNAQLKRMKYKDNNEEIVRTFRVPRKDNSSLNALYEKRNLPIVSDGKHLTTVLIETKDRIWDNGFTLKYEYNEGKLSITCPELSVLKQPQLKNIYGGQSVEWGTNAPKLTSMQTAYYVYYLKHHEFPSSTTKTSKLKEFIDEIVKIYKPIETIKTSSNSTSLKKTIQKYEKFKSNIEGLSFEEIPKVFKKIEDTISEMNERIERVSPFLIIRKETLEKQSSRYIMPLEWLMDKG